MDKHGHHCSLHRGEAPRWGLTTQAAHTQHMQLCAVTHTANSPALQKQSSSHIGSACVCCQPRTAREHGI
jgi:hypothetical protein